MRLSFILDLSPSHRREAESETDPDERIWERICYILLSNGVLYFVSSSNVVMHVSYHVSFSKVAVFAIQKLFKFMVCGWAGSGVPDVLEKRTIQ